MRQKLVIHIGAHKTGSTTIQNYLYFNRLWLPVFGVFYPKPVNGPLFYANNHSDLRDTARSEGQRRNPHIHRAYGRFDDLLKTYIDTIRARNKPVNILSCEGWSANLNLYANRMIRLRDHFDVSVVAFVRRPDYWIESLYRQRVVNFQHQESRSFEEFAGLKSMETAIYDRARILGWWGKAFGHDNVTALPYEPAADGFDLIGRFFDAAGIADGRVRRLILRKARANPSMSAAQIEIIRLLHKHGHQVDTKLLRQLRRRVQGGATGYLSPADRTLLLARAAPDMQAVCDIYVKDGRHELFPRDPEHASNADTWDRRSDPEFLETFAELLKERS